MRRSSAGSESAEEAGATPAARGGGERAAIRPRGHDPLGFLLPFLSDGGKGLHCQPLPGACLRPRLLKFASFGAGASGGYQCHKWASEAGRSGADRVVHSAVRSRF